MRLENESVLKYLNMLVPAIIIKHPKTRREQK